METSASDLLKKVRKIEIRTKALSHQIFAGEYHSAFKGRGMAFSEVREYQYGDDVRNMDWNVTARLRAPYVKVFEEEREMTVMLLVDISRSGLFGTVGETKRDMLAEIAARFIGHLDQSLFEDLPAEDINTHGSQIASGMSRFLLELGDPVVFVGNDHSKAACLLDGYRECRNGNIGIVCLMIIQHYLIIHLVNMVAG